jgi:hypothetical protein
MNVRGIVTWVNVGMVIDYRVGQSRDFSIQWTCVAMTLQWEAGYKIP